MSPVLQALREEIEFLEKRNLRHDENHVEFLRRLADRIEAIERFGTAKYGDDR